MNFCGQEHFHNDHDDSQQNYVKPFIMGAVIVVVVLGGVKLGLDWFVFKDYYPLKERSPLLCIMLIVVISMELIIYPSMYIYSFYTAEFSQYKCLYRSLYGAFWNASYFLYMLRAFRICYAHEVDSSRSRSKSLAFQVFKRESLLVCVFLFWIAVRFVLICANWKQFQMITEIVNPGDGIIVLDHLKQRETQLFYQYLIWNFVWQALLLYCVWLQNKVNTNYSMRKQLLIVYFMCLITSVIITVLPFTTKQTNDTLILGNLCDKLKEYPIIQLLKSICLLVMLLVSLIYPITKKKVYHMLLPTGRHYGFVKTMRDFLMEREFLQVFTKYLEHLDDDDDREKSTLLQFWKKLIVLKLDRETQEIDKLSSIKSLIEEVQIILFRQEQRIILNLKQSIVSLQQSINNSDILKQRYRQSINEKVDELQKIALQRLDRIYVNDYRKTYSYRYLRQIMKENKRINVNMILLNMALIVDFQNQYLE